MLEKVEDPYEEVIRLRPMCPAGDTVSARSPELRMSDHILMNTKQSTKSSRPLVTNTEWEARLATSEGRRATKDDVTRILAEASSIDLAAPLILQATGEGLGWAAGRIWTKPPRGDLLVCNATWFEPSIIDSELKAISYQLNLPLAAELRDYVSRNGEPTWSNLGEDAGLAWEVDKYSATPYWTLVCPIRARNLNLGVIEFIGRGRPLSEDDLLITVTNLGYQIGQFMELRIAEAYLERTEERFQAILDNSPAAIYIKDTLGRYVLFNQWHENLLGFEKEQTKGKTDHELLSKDIADNVSAHDAAVLESGTAMVWEETFPHEDGLHTYISTKFPLRNLDGVITAIGGISTDITERKHAEDALRAYAEQLDKLHEMGAAILAAQLPESIAEAVLTHIGRVIPCSRATISLLEPEATEVKAFTVDCRNGITIVEDTGISLREIWDLGTLQEGKLTDIPDIMALPQADLPLTLRNLQADGVRALITLPLISHQGLVGTLTVCSNIPDAFASSPTLFHMVQVIAGKLTIAIQNAWLFQQVHSGHEMLQAMSARLINAQESERRHTARELHDEIGQALTAVKMNLQFVRCSTAAVEGQSAIDESIQIVEQALEQVRSLALDLRPSMLDDLGLVSALRWYVDRFRARSGIDVNLSASSVKPRLPTEIEIACFRVAQEALTNVMRHAHARQVQVRVRQQRSELQLHIHDDGIGFDFQAARKRAISGDSLGLLGMQERVEQLGGSLSIETSPRNGTRVTAHFPIALSRSRGKDSNGRNMR